MFVEDLAWMVLFYKNVSSEVLRLKTWCMGPSAKVNYNSPYLSQLRSQLSTPPLPPLISNWLSSFASVC
jgi:hypothetical protein